MAVRNGARVKYVAEPVSIRKSEEIKQAIIHEMDRGVTGLYGRTGFLEEDTEMLMFILSVKELPKTEKLIRSIDSTAFVVVNKANEVYGRGTRYEQSNK